MENTDVDGCAYDADLCSPNCIFQYNYSHDNAMGLITLCTDPSDSNVIVRYNISAKDKGRILNVNYSFVSTYFYNNIFYIPSNLSPKIIWENSNGKVQTYYYYNNIVYNLSTTSVYTFASATRTFDYNVFYGQHPANEPSDSHKLTSDPMFVNPSGAGTGRSTCDGFMLQASSPCINSGKTISGNGGKDFWGNTVPYSGGTADRGAHEYQGTPGPTPTPGGTPTPTPTPGGGTTNINPTADTYASGGAPTTNYGTATEVQIKDGTGTSYDRIGYAKYSLSSFSSVSSAVLYLYSNTAVTSTPVTVTGLTDDSWTETGLTWNNQPSTAGATTIGNINMAAAGWYSIDVTSYVQSQMTDKVVSFKLADTTQKITLIKTNSRENASNKPYLAVTP